VPIATDTAFAIALIVVLRERVPVELRVFLTAAVIVDDLVAIVVVALFYSGAIDVQYLALAVVVTLALAGLNYAGVYRPSPYAVLGVALWTWLHQAGIHATLAGVILAIVTPTRPPNLRALVAQADTVFPNEIEYAAQGVLRHGPSEPAMRALDAIHNRIESPADKLLRSVEPWSSYVVLPLFALSNAGVVWSPGIVNGHVGLIVAIVPGLVLGKRSASSVRRRSRCAWESRQSPVPIRGANCSARARSAESGLRCRCSSRTRHFRRSTTSPRRKLRFSRRR
jgi:NhaA family Na+:H+ antiporter